MKRFPRVAEDKSQLQKFADETVNAINEGGDVFPEIKKIDKEALNLKTSDFKNLNLKTGDVLQTIDDTYFITIKGREYQLNCFYLHTGQNNFNPYVISYIKFTNGTFSTPDKIYFQPRDGLYRLTGEIWFNQRSNPSFECGIYFSFIVNYIFDTTNEFQSEIGEYFKNAGFIPCRVTDDHSAFLCFGYIIGEPRGFKLYSAEDGNILIDGTLNLEVTTISVNAYNLYTNQLLQTYDL